MDIETLKHKIRNGEITSEELMNFALDKENYKSSETDKSQKQEAGFMGTIVNGFMDGYVAPNKLRLKLELLLIFLLIVGIIVLAVTKNIDSTITAVFLSLILGFLFGKIK